MREGRFNFPRPFGNILSEYRPLIPTKFSDAPSNVAVIATRLDENNIANEIGLTPAEGKYFMDFKMNLRGVDEFSTSSLAFTPEGDFLGGQVRVSTFKPPRDSNVDMKVEIQRLWREFLQDELNLRFDEDDLSILVRDNTNATAEHPPLTPHLIFTSISPSTNNPSPVSTPELLSTLELMKEKWPWKFDQFRMSARVKRGFGSGEESVIGTVDDMLDNLRD